MTHNMHTKQFNMNNDYLCFYLYSYLFKTTTNLKSSEGYRNHEPEEKICNCSLYSRDESKNGIIEKR